MEKVKKHLKEIEGAKTDSTRRAEFNLLKEKMEDNKEDFKILTNIENNLFSNPFNFEQYSSNFKNYFKLFSATSINTIKFHLEAIRSLQQENSRFLRFVVLKKDLSNHKEDSLILSEIEFTIDFSNFDSSSRTRKIRDISISTRKITTTERRI